MRLVNRCYADLKRSRCQGVAETLKGRTKPICNLPSYDRVHWDLTAATVYLEHTSFPPLALPERVSLQYAGLC